MQDSLLIWTYFRLFYIQYFVNFVVMPKVRRSRKPPPDGWELIEPTLEELEQKMREGNVS